MDTEETGVCVPVAPASDAAPLVTTPAAAAVAITKKDRALDYCDEARAVGIIFERTREAVAVEQNQKLKKGTKWSDELNEYMGVLWNVPPLEDRADFDRLFAILRDAARSAVERRLAWEELVYRNIRLVFFVAKRHVQKAAPFLTIADLMQEGVFGLCTAIEKYDPNRAQFSTVAVQWIWQAIQRAIQDASPQKPFRIPVHMQESMEAVHWAVESFEKKHGRNPSALEIMQRIRRREFEKYLRGVKQPGPAVTLKTVKSCLRLLNIHQQSLNVPILVDGHNKKALHEVVASKKTPRPDTVAAAKEELAECRKQLLDVVGLINALPPREAMIMRLRLGLIPGLPKMSHREIGARYDLTGSRIQQLEERALRLLAKAGLEINPADLGRNEEEEEQSEAAEADEDVDGPDVEYVEDDDAEDGEEGSDGAE